MHLTRPKASRCSKASRYVETTWLRWIVMFTGHTEIQLVVATATWRSHYLILGSFPAAFGVPISQDDALFVNSGLLLAALFEHPDFQATSQDDGSVTYTHNKYKYVKCFVFHKQNKSVHAVERQRSPTVNNLGDLRLVSVKFKRSQESQGAQVKGHNWWNALLQINKAREPLCHTSKGRKKAAGGTAGRIPGKAKTRTAEFHLPRGR